MTKGEIIKELQQQYTKEEILKAIELIFLLNDLVTLQNKCREQKNINFAEKTDIAFREYKIANAEYISFMKEHVYGKKLCELPQTLIDEGVKLEKRVKELWLKYEKICKEYDKYFYTIFKEK